MFSLPVILVIGLVMFIIQVSIWQMLPVKLKDVVFANPVFAFLVNLFGSGLIASFTGIASIVGICNLFASVLFGVYAFIYSRNKGISGLSVGWFKIWNAVPVFPKLMVNYSKNGKLWSA